MNVDSRTSISSGWWPEKPSLLVALQRLIFARTTLEAQLYPALRHGVSFRLFRPGDHDACMEIYVKNETDRFPKDHRPKFEQYLSKEEKDLIVAESNSRVIGYGGINLVAPNIGILCYGIVDPAFQRQRIGSALTLLRIAQLATVPSGNFFLILAVDASMPVYRKFGFVECARWNHSDGANHPLGFLHVSKTSLTRVKACLHRRRLNIQGTVSLHLSKEVTCEITEIGIGRFRLQIQPRAEGSVS